MIGRRCLGTCAAVALVIVASPAYAGPLPAAPAERLLISDKPAIQASPLTPEQSAEDLSVLITMLRSGYAGSLYGEGKPLDNVLRELEEKYDAVADTDSQKLCDTIAKVLYKFPDNHLSVWHMMVRCGTRPLLLAENTPAAYQAKGTRYLFEIGRGNHIF